MAREKEIEDILVCLVEQCQQTMSLDNLSLIQMQSEFTNKYQSMNPKESHYNQTIIHQNLAIRRLIL